MLNQRQAGDTVAVVAPSGGFISGNAYALGAALFGIAGFTCAAGAMGELWLKGTYALAKTSAQAWVLGDIIYWNAGTSLCSNVSTDGPRIGIATAAAANPSATCEVRLDGLMNPVVS
jgi:predicted RecA/RadA family phage recombinase